MTEEEKLLNEQDYHQQKLSEEEEQQERTRNGESTFDEMKYLPTHWKDYKQSSPTHESERVGDGTFANYIPFTPFSPNMGSTQNCKLNENVNMENNSRIAPIAGYPERQNAMSNRDEI